MEYQKRALLLTRVLFAQCFRAAGSDVYVKPFEANRTLACLLPGGFPSVLADKYDTRSHLVSFRGDVHRRVRVGKIGGDGLCCRTVNSRGNFCELEGRKFLHNSSQ